MALIKGLIKEINEHITHVAVLTTEPLLHNETLMEQQCTKEAMLVLGGILHPLFFCFVAPCS